MQVCELLIKKVYDLSISLRYKNLLVILNTETINSTCSSSDFTFAKILGSASTNNDTGASAETVAEVCTLCEQDFRTSPSSRPVVSGVLGRILHT